MTGNVTSHPLKAILAGGMVAGILDITYAIIATQVAGNSPIRMLKGIAGGILGREVITTGGWAVAVLGLTLHFVITHGAATTYFLVSRKLTFLIRYAPVCGILYGAIVYLVMNRVVLPLSALAATPPFRVQGLLAIMLLVGPPIALAVRRYAPN